MGAVFSEFLQKLVAKKKSCKQKKKVIKLKKMNNRGDKRMFSL